MTRGLANTAPGDPGSIARLATAAGVVQRRLAALDPPKPPVTDDLPRRLDRVHRELDRQRCSLDRARTTAAAELGTVGEALRTHADELSTTHASLRAVLDRAAARGLVLEDRHLRPDLSRLGERGRRHRRRIKCRSIAVPRLQCGDQTPQSAVACRGGHGGRGPACQAFGIGAHQDGQSRFQQAAGFALVRAEPRGQGLQDVEACRGRAVQALRAPRLQLRQRRQRVTVHRHRDAWRGGEWARSRRGGCARGLPRWCWRLPAARRRTRRRTPTRTARLRRSGCG